MFRKISVLALVLAVLSFSLVLAGCTGATTTETTTVTEESPPLLTEGVFDGSFAADGYGITVNFIKFYPEDENTGKSIYYFSVSGDQDQVAGYYTVEETGFNYSTWYNRDDRLSIAAETLMISGVASYTITLYDFLDNQLTQFGYDVVNNSGIIYGFNLEGYPDFIQDVCYFQKTENLDIYEETKLEIFEFMVAGDYNTKLSVWHDGTFTFKTDTTIEGTWVTSTTSNVYSLYDSEGQSFGTLGVSSAGDIGTLLPTGGTKLNLVIYVAEIFLTFSGSDTNHVFTDAMVLEMYLYMYVDNTIEVEVEYGGIALEGTWSTDGTGSYIFDLVGSDLTFNTGSGNEDNSVITINVTNSYNDVTGDLVFNVED